MKHYTIKQVNALEYQILQKFLYEALFQPDPKNLFPFSIVETAELNKYIDNFGQLIGDYAIASYEFIVSSGSFHFFKHTLKFLVNLILKITIYYINNLFILFFSPPIISYIKSTTLRYFET